MDVGYRLQRVFDLVAVDMLAVAMAVDKTPCPFQASALRRIEGRGTHFAPAMYASTRRCCSAFCSSVSAISGALSRTGAFAL